MKELSLNILDIVQNSIRAKADKISITVTESEISDIYEIIIEDNGTGIAPEILQNVTDAFVTTRAKRKMGMGLALLKYHAEMTGGNLVINSELGKGTIVKAVLSNKHIDRQPMGDITGVLVMLMASDDKINYIYHHVTDYGEYRFSSQETKEFLGVESLSDRILLEEIHNIIDNNLEEIKASGIDLKKCSDQNN
jgi:hypothetical protein